MSCNGCKKETPIVNRKYGLCPNCNSLRLHNKSISDRAIDSSKKYLAKAQERFKQRVTEETEHVVTYRQRSSLKRTAIRQQTQKEAAVKSHLSILKRDIELEAVQNNEYYCKGCGKAHVGLDKSHILSVGQYKHLELIRANIQLLCRDCHTTWESGTIGQQMKLHCFIDNIQWIYTQDQVAYRKFITRIEEYKVWLIEEKDQEKIRVITEILEAVVA